MDNGLGSSDSETGHHLLDRASYRVRGRCCPFHFFALLNSTVERLWWAGLAGIAAVLAWFLFRKMIRDLQYEFWYAEDDNITDQD